MESSTHKAGFVNIVGKPNVGKSTLMNQLVGERLSIITSKAQTTRHRIMGIINGDDFQIIYSDTPGILKPEYELHESMMGFVRSSIEDADILLVIAELGEKYDEELFAPVKKTEGKIIFILNKIDQAKGSQVEDKLNYWKEKIQADHYIPVSALEGLNVGKLFQTILAELPVHPPYYPKDALTDKPERFFVEEIIREKIFLNYKKEVPYSSEVAVEEFKEEEDIIRIRAIIYVERKSQKGIIIGKGGEMLKKVGTEARKDMEEFFRKKIFLETFVKVAENWRKVESKLKQFGYK
ncbi:MAG: GTPase Era [Candidatus Cyclobacteriaceae bacterium M2_1C_046]